MLISCILNWHYTFVVLFTYRPACSLQEWHALTDFLFRLAQGRNGICDSDTAIRGCHSRATQLQVCRTSGNTFALTNCTVFAIELSCKICGCTAALHWQFQCGVRLLLKLVDHPRSDVSWSLSKSDSGSFSGQRILRITG